MRLRWGGERDALDLLQLLDTALHQRRLVGLVAEAADERLDALDLLVLPPLLLAQGGDSPVALLDVAAVVAGVLGELAVPDLDDAADHLVEEVAVVGNQYHRMRVALQIILQPVAGRQVEVVGRFVEQQQVGALQQQLGQGDAHLPAAGEGLAGLLPVGLRKAETAQHFADLRLHGVAAALGEELLGLGVAGQQLAVPLAETRFEPLEFLFEGQQSGQRRAHLGEQRPAVVLEPLLRQVAEAGPLGGLHLAAVDSGAAGQHLEQGGLAGAVLAAQADAVLRADVQVDTGEDPAVGEILDDIPQLQHAPVIAQRERGRNTLLRHRNRSDGRDKPF